MPLPYTNTVTREGLIGGQTYKVVLPVPYRGVLQRLVVVQTDGVLAGFSFNLFDREDACAGESTDSSNLDDAAVSADPRCHKLQATQTVAGSAAASEQYGMGLSYANRDEQDKYLRQPTRALYLDLQVSGTGAKRFQVAFTVDQDSLM